MSTPSKPGKGIKAAGGGMAAWQQKHADMIGEAKRRKKLKGQCPKCGG